MSRSSSQTSTSSLRTTTAHTIDVADPSVELGFVPQFDEEVDLECRNLQLQESEQRRVHFRILTRNGPLGRLGEVRFEIFDDNDLFFFVEAVLNAEDFEELKNTEELLISFDEFPNEVQTMLKESLVQSSESQVTFIEGEDGDGRLEFTQLLQLKAVEIFRLKFEASQPELVQKHVQYRYNKLAAQCAEKKLMVSEFNKQMQSRNPILLRAINGPPTVASPKKSG
jgi:hypothetical protein